MSLPRLLSLDQDGTLRIRELPQIASLRDGEIKSSHTGDTTNVVLSHANGEVVCIGQPGRDFTLSIRAGTNELMMVNYVAATHTLVADGKHISLEPTDTPRVHAFVDASVIEMILAERVGYTKRFYYPGKTAPSIDVHAKGWSGLSLKAWKIEPISSDRLTTTA